MTRGAKRRIVLVAVVFGCVVGGSVALRPLWDVPENIKDARRFLAPYHANDRSGMTSEGGFCSDGSPYVSEVTNFEIPEAVDVETARMFRELPTSHGWTVRPGNFNSSIVDSRAMSLTVTPFERWISTIPVLNRFVHPHGTFITITLSARKDIEQKDFEKERLRWARGEMWTSAEVESSGAALGREARVLPKHGHNSMYFPVYLRRKYAGRGKMAPRP